MGSAQASARIYDFHVSIIQLSHGCACALYFLQFLPRKTSLQASKLNLQRHPRILPAIYRRLTSRKVGGAENQPKKQGSKPTMRHYVAQKTYEHATQHLEPEYSIGQIGYTETIYRNLQTAGTKCSHTHNEKALIKPQKRSTRTFFSGVPSKQQKDLPILKYYQYAGYLSINLTTTDI